MQFVRLLSFVCVVSQFHAPKAASLPMLNCGSCAGSCSFGSEFEHCRCDADCVLYGDCCANRSTVCPTSVVFTELEERNYDYECRLLLSGRGGDVSYIWMVTTCPEGMTPTDLIVQNCISDNDSLALPVTDRSTGAVFKNEYCAACNGVTDYASWSYEVQCMPAILEAITNNSGTITQEDLNLYCSFNVYLSPTGLSVADARDCYPVLDSCPTNETTGMDLANTTGLSYQAVADLCVTGSYQLAGNRNLHSLFAPAYRNLYCALCAGVPAGDVDCFDPLTAGGGPIGIPFTLFLDVNGGGLIATSSETTATVTVSCTDGQVYDITSNQCRDTICYNGIEIVFGTDCFSECNESLIELNETDSFQYIGENSVLFANQVLEVEFNTSRGFPVVCINITENGTELVNVVDSFSECNESLIELNETDSFQYIGNNSVLFANQVFEVEFNTSRGFPVVCINFTENGTELVNVTITVFRYPEAYFILTYIGCSLSVIACVLLLVTYGLFKELRTLPSRIVMNLTVAIIIGNLLILLGGPVTVAFLTIELCASVAILLHYFFLSQFSWMSIISFEMTHTFYRAYKLRPTESKGFKRNLLVTYIFIGWGAPLIITAVTMIVNYTTDGLVLYGVQEDGTLGSCWINHLDSSVAAFIAPLALSLLFNSVAFVATMLLICVTARSQSKGRLHKNTNVPYIRLTVAVFSISGLTWLFGLLAIFSSVAWTWYPFIVFNTLQGLFIFVVFLATKRVILLYLNLFGIKRKASVDVKKLNASKQSAVDTQLLQKASTERRSSGQPQLQLTNPRDIPA